MKDRLLQLLNKLGLSATKFADEIEVQRSGISHILSGRNQPSYDFLVKILTRFPDINAEWLILGKGVMFNTDITVKQPSAVKDKPLVIQQMDLFSNEIIKDSEPIPPSHPNKVTNVTVISRILLLNSDGTFDVFLAAKKD